MSGFLVIFFFFFFSPTSLKVVGQNNKMGENVCTVFKLGVSGESFLSVV